MDIRNHGGTLGNGGIPNRSVENFHQPALEMTTVQGERVYYKPPRGYYDGQSWVYTNQPQLKAENILSTANVMGVQGSIPNYGRAVLGQVYTTPRSFKADGGGNLVVEPNRGYYEEGLNNNGYGSIIVSDTNFVPSNIVSGKSIFGVNGTAVQGKRWASGTGTVITLSSERYMQATYNLDFVPSTIICVGSSYMSSVPAILVYSPSLVGSAIQGKDTVSSGYYNSSGGISRLYSNDVREYVNSTGFTLYNYYALNTSTFQWYAFE